MLASPLRTKRPGVGLNMTVSFTFPLTAIPKRCRLTIKARAYPWGGGRSAQAGLSTEYDASKCQIGIARDWGGRRRSLTEVGSGFGLGGSDSGNPSRTVHVRWARHFEDRVYTPKRIGHCSFSRWVRQPLAIRYQQVFVGARRQDQLFPPPAIPHRHHSRGLGAPVVEGPGYRNGASRRVCEFYVHQL
jgi:hypothetical protein